MLNFAPRTIPGIHLSNIQAATWIPGLALTRYPGMTSISDYPKYTLPNF
jgi:hypothetical protein